MSMRKLLCLVLLAVALTGCAKSRDPLLLGNANGRYSAPTSSPDGKRLAFLFEEQLWVADADGNRARRITGSLFSAEVSRVRTAEWLPDGRLAYVDSRKGQKANLSRNTLLIYDFGTKKTKMVKDNLPPVYDLSWHPTSSSEALLLMNVSADVRAPGDSAVFEIDVKTGNLGQIPSIPTHPELSSIEWLGDGGRVAFVLNGSLMVWDRTSGVITRADQESKAIGRIATAPDGKWIIYRQFGVPGDGRQRGTYIVPSDLSAQPAKVTSDEMVWLDWSPDGQRIVFTTVGSPGTNQLRMFSVAEEYRP